MLIRTLRRQTTFQHSGLAWMSDVLAQYSPEFLELRCVVCGRTPSQTTWGAHRVTYSPDRSQELSREPCQDGCRECRDAVSEALLPAAADWNTISDTCKKDAKVRASYNDYRLRKAGKFC